MAGLNDFYADNLMSIQTDETNDQFNIKVAGEMAGNTAERLIDLLDHAMLINNSLKFVLNLCKVTYVSSFSFGVIALLWKEARENGRSLSIIVNSAINEKFKRMGLNNNIDMKVISYTGSHVPAYL